MRMTSLGFTTSKRQIRLEVFMILLQSIIYGPSKIFFPINGVNSKTMALCLPLNLIKLERMARDGSGTVTELERSRSVVSGQLRFTFLNFISYSKIKTGWRHLTNQVYVTPS